MDDNDDTQFCLGSPVYWAEVEFLADNEDEFGEEWAWQRTLQLAALYNGGDVLGMISYTKDHAVER